MSKTFMPAFQSMESLKAHQLKGLQWTVSHAHKGSGFYRKQLDNSGVTADDIRTLDDICRLPFAKKLKSVLW